MATTEDPRARADGTAEWKRELYDAKPAYWRIVHGRPRYMSA